MTMADVIYLTREEINSIPFGPIDGPGLKWRERDVDENHFYVWENGGNGEAAKIIGLVEVVTVEQRIKAEVDKIMKPKPAAPPAPTAGPMMTDLSKRVPDIMGELMKDFVERRDLNSRAQIRLRMKALLDLFSADTGYPPIPALSPSSRMGRGAFAAGGNDYMGAPAYQVAPAPPLRAGGEADMLQREVAAAVDEQRAAAEPVDLIPAPGAPVAEPGINHV
jgi:hypothetical protein